MRPSDDGRRPGDPIRIIQLQPVLGARGAEIEQGNCYAIRFVGDTALDDRIAEGIGIAVPLLFVLILLDTVGDIQDQRQF